MKKSGASQGQSEPSELISKESPNSGLARGNPSRMRKLIKGSRPDVVGPHLQLIRDRHRDPEIQRSLAKPDKSRHRDADHLQLDPAQRDTTADDVCRLSETAPPRGVSRYNDSLLTWSCVSAGPSVRPRAAPTPSMVK